MVEAAIAYLEHAREISPQDSAIVFDELIRFQRHRMNLIDGTSDEGTGLTVGHYDQMRDLSKHVQALQRATILHLRNENQINDEVLRKLEYELDLVEARFSASGNA